MAIDFPNSPTQGDTYTVGGRSWTWNGTVWASTEFNSSEIQSDLDGLIQDLDGHVLATTNVHGILDTSQLLTISDLGAYAPIENPSFTGTVSLPTETSIGNVSSTEIGYLDGVDSPIQSQLNGKADDSHSHLINDVTDINASATEINHLVGVASNVQAQLDAKSDTSHTHILLDITDVQASATEVNYSVGVTSSIQSQLDEKSNTAHTHLLADITDVFASSAEVNILNGAVIDTTELNYLDGVTSSIQGQLDSKSEDVHTHILADITDVNASATEVNYLVGVTSLVQDQIDDKEDIITGAATTIVSNDLNASRALTSDVNGKVAATLVTTTELEYLQGVTSLVQDQLDSKSDISHVHVLADVTDVTATAAEVNILEGATLSTTELNYVDGVTSPIQSQLNGKQESITGAATTITNTDLTASRALESNTSGKVVASTVTSDELGYLSGVTSSIQEQLDDKAPTADPTFTGTTTTTYAHITPTSTKPATWSEGNLYYDSEEKTLILQGSGTTFEMSMGQREWVRCRNGSASTIYKGQPVYGYGVHIPGDPVHGHHILVDLADASDVTKKNVIGLAGEDIAAGTHGYVVTRGYLEGIDTSNLTSGHRVHLGFASPGTLVEVSPTYPNYPMDVGICLTSDATNGTLYIEMSHHSFERIRVENNAYVDGNLTVGGDFTLLGSQSSIELVNLQVQNSFVYLNSGDTIGASNTTFSGSGLNDAVFTGQYEGTASNKTFKVKINGVGTGTGGVDTFIWSTDDFSTSSATIDVSTSPIALEDGIYIDFVADIGHTVDDVWSGTASPINVDSGWFANRNTGTSGIGYTHMGVFYDISDEKFKFVNAYSPEPSGTIDTGDSSYESGTVVASSFEGGLTGDVTGNLLNGMNAIDGVAVGTESAGDVLYHDGSSWVNKYLNAIPAQRDEVTLISNNYSISSGDEGMILEVNNSAAPATVTIPSAESFPVGTQIVIIQTGAGGDLEIQVEAPATQTLNSSPGPKLRGQWSAATLLKRGTNLWIAYGDLKA